MDTAEEAEEEDEGEGAIKKKGKKAQKEVLRDEWRGEEQLSEGEGGDDATEGEDEEATEEEGAIKKKDK